MRGDAGVDYIVHRERRQMTAVEASQHALESAIAEGLTRRILRLDHTIGIPDDKIAGAHWFLDHLGRAVAAGTKRVAATDERLQVELTVGAHEVRRGRTARYKSYFARIRIKDRREASHRELAATDAADRGV